MADTPSQSSGSLPSWWHDASASSSLCASPSASSEYAAARIDAPTVSAALCRRGFYVLDNFIGIPSAPAAILSGIQELDQAGKMRVGKIQNATTQKVNTQSRTDRIAFLPSPQQSQKKKMPNKASDDERACLTIPASECSEALLAYTRAADAMRVLLTDEDRLVERVGGSLDDCNYMCACYPGGGARYVKHRDALPYKAGRKLTVIYYLNAHWQPGHGGELCIWPADDEHTETPEVVEPRADRLVIFISSLEHEVLPAWRPRYALTTWMFNRKDTALELFAEEMRQKKAQGKFNTAALLAAIDAASSDEEEEAPTPVDGEEMVDRNAALSVVVGLLNRKQSREPATKKVDKPADKAEPPGDKSAAKPRPAIPPPQAPPHGQEFLNLAKTGDLQAMEPLLRANPELLMYNGKGCSLGMIGHTALHWAASKNHQDLAIWLLKEGLPVNARNGADSTPLHTAAQNGRKKMTRTLLNAGADPAAMNADGETPIDLAKERGHDAVAKLIEEAGDGDQGQVTLS